MGIALPFVLAEADPVADKLLEVALASTVEDDGGAVDEAVIDAEAVEVDTGVPVILLLVPLVADIFVELSDASWVGEASAEVVGVLEAAIVADVVAALLVFALTTLFAVAIAEVEDETGAIFPYASIIAS